jgi:hypothetical protein
MKVLECPEGLLEALCTWIILRETLSKPDLDSLAETEINSGKPVSAYAVRLLKLNINT